MELSRFKALSFDCYGTLIDWETGILTILRDLAGDNPEPADDEALAAFGGAEQAIQKQHPSMLYSEVLYNVYKQIAGDLGLAGDDLAAKRFAGSIGNWEPFDDSVEALAWLREHYRLAVLSNVDKQSFARSHEKLGKPFDYVFTAEEIGSYKPDHRNFNYLIANMEKDGVRQNELLHVAQSRYHDIGPANDLGIASVWVNRRYEREGDGATISAPDSVQPDLEVRSLAELVALHRDALGGT